MSLLRRLPSLFPSLPSTSLLPLPRAHPLPLQHTRTLRLGKGIFHPSYDKAVPQFRSALDRRATQPLPDGTLRPNLHVPVKEDHGLWMFFHRDKEGVAVSLEMGDKRTDYSGRSWSAPELRRKSFLDLHTLWYVLQRERNVLYTQLEEWKKVGGVAEQFTNIYRLNRRCRKSLARIKYVLNERRLAFKSARLIEQKVAKNNVRNQRRLARKAARLAEEGGAAGTSAGEELGAEPAV